MTREEELKEWHKIGDKLTGYFNICGCQRKLKTIVDNLVSIYEKCDKHIHGEPYDFTGAEWLLIAMLNSFSNSVSHGTNCEYPIINQNDEFWKWIMEVKDNPCLKDN